jgi:hypothetical protein
VGQEFLYPYSQQIAKNKQGGKFGFGAPILIRGYHRALHIQLFRQFGLGQVFQFSQKAKVSG